MFSWQDRMQADVTGTYFLERGFSEFNSAVFYRYQIKKLAPHED